ncbi:MAG: NifU family protein [Solirubrobacteraceae bacterium]
MENQPLLAISARALERARAFRAALPDAAGIGLWVRVTGAANGEYTCALSLNPVGLAAIEDFVQDEGDLTIVVPADGVEKVRGATIEWREEPPQSGFAVLNPNKPRRPLTLPVLPISMPTGPGDGLAVRRAPPASSAPLGNLDSEIARAVIAVLERDVNPSIAAHGGHAELVAIEGATAFLRLGGGCQGCGMATVTLSQGIEVAITEAVPEIDSIVDVTDHASGSNPYFEPAKK